ncbi:MAG TPA: hypothetical protein VF135_14730 [Terriglobales bacterium]
MLQRATTRLLFFIFAFMAVSLAGFGQEREGHDYVGHGTVRPFVESYTTKADGYQGWGFYGNGGIEYWLKHTTITARAGVDTTDKKLINSGTTLRLEGNGYYNFTRNFFAGGGAAWGRLGTSDYSKQAVYPYFGGGFGCSDVVFTANYYLSGTDKSNGLRGVRLETALPIQRHVQLVQAFGIFSAYPTDCPTCQRVIVNDLRLGMRYRF